MVGITSYQTPITTIPQHYNNEYRKSRGNFALKSKQDGNEIHEIIFLDCENAKSEKRLFFIPIG
jgi:hypothetical protein